MPDTLKPSADRKVWAYKNQKNTVGLLPGPEGTCPGATIGPGGCRVVGGGRPACYVYKVMSIYKGVRAVLAHNTKLLMEAGPEEQVRLLNAEMERFKTVSRNAFTHADKYRLHWSGDIFDQQYADSLRAMMITHSDITFWTYTRSFEFVTTFEDVTNLQLYLSLDDCNMQEGFELYNKVKWSNLHLCVMSGAPPEIAGESFLGCPVDSGKVPLEGACQRCMLCLKGYDIWFKTKK